MCQLSLWKRGLRSVVAQRGLMCVRVADSRGFTFVSWTQTVKEKKKRRENEVNENENERLRVRE